MEILEVKMSIKKEENTIVVSRGMQFYYVYV